ncbi:MAG: GlcNAc-PI de-N-acetylase [Dehalococcoidia bacterium]|nr:MAG: GlcNAc-PI de-N-acetylase [Dehalococcoidia bacterium]
MSEMPEEYRSILVITAHPDDMEFGCGGSVAKWCAEGRDVFLVISTNGDKGSSDRSMTSERLAKIRAAEQAEACKVLGIKEFRILGYPDGFLTDNPQFQGDIVRAIRTYRPDVVVCQDPVRRLSLFAQHRDHRVAGSVALDSVFPAARDHLYFPEQVAEGLEPHKTAEAWVMGAEFPDVYVDITDHIDTKIAALRCHVSQVGQGEGLAERVREGAANLGETPGFAYAEAFKRLKYRR